MYRKVWYEGVPIDDLRIVFEEALSYIIIQLIRVVASEVQVTGPYKAGFLAFREVDHFKHVIDFTKHKHLNDVPQVIVTGGGLHHPQGMTFSVLHLINCILSFICTSLCFFTNSVNFVISLHDLKCIGKCGVKAYPSMTCESSLKKHFLILVSS